LKEQKGFYFSVARTKDLKMSEISEIAKIISESVDSSAKVIFGAYYDRSLKDKSIKVTVVATGFNGIFSEKKAIPNLFSFKEEHHLKESDETLNKNKEEDKQFLNKDKEMEKDIFFGDKNEPWDIPAFLRKKKK
jgi:Cell division GTPase